MMTSEQIIALQECERLNRECGKATEAFCKTIRQTITHVDELSVKLMEVI